MGLVCTNCFRDTHVEPDFGDLPVEAAIALATDWRCNDCLDDLTPSNEESQTHGS